MGSEIDENFERFSLLFLHKLLTLSHNTVAKEIFMRKYIQHTIGCETVSLGFIPDICSLLQNYKLQFIMNDYIDKHIIPPKNTWKRIVNSSVANLERHQTEARMSADHDFAFFNILHPISKPAVVYSVCNTSKMRHIGNIIARLWTRPVTLDNFRCEQCSEIYQEQLVHILCECSNTATHRAELFVISLVGI